MKWFSNIINSKNKDYIIAFVVSVLCVLILVTMKVVENKNFESFINTHTLSSNLESFDNHDEVFSYDTEYFYDFIGKPTSDLFEHLESNFWEVLENKESYTTYQNANGETITIYYNESNIIEVITNS